MCCRRRRRRGRRRVNYAKDHVSHRMGKIATRSELANRYGVKVKWLSELQDHCSKAKATSREAGTRIAERGLMRPCRFASGAPDASPFDHDPEPLFCRISGSSSHQVHRRTKVTEVRKSWVSSNAHAEVMREAKAGMMEYQLSKRDFCTTARHKLCGNQPVRRGLRRVATPSRWRRGVWGGEI